MQTYQLRFHVRCAGVDCKREGGVLANITPHGNPVATKSLAQFFCPSGWSVALERVPLTFDSALVWFCDSCKEARQ